MQVVTSEQGCVGIIALTGRIDATTASSFETSCRELLDSGAKKVVVDLGGVEYISSAGLRGILTMVKASKARRGDAGVLFHAVDGGGSFQNFGIQLHAPHLRHARRGRQRPFLRRRSWRRSAFRPVLSSWRMSMPLSTRPSLLHTGR